MIKNLVIIILLIVMALQSRVIVRLESYRYADFVGMCSEYNPKDPTQAMQRHTCLNNAKTRTNPLWHLLYALTD